MLEISKDGVTAAKPRLAVIAGREVWTFAHGQEGRNRKRIQIPLLVRDFPAEPVGFPPIGPYALGAWKPMFLRAGEEDDQQMVLWSLDSGFRGGAEYEVYGAATVVAEGREAQGDAGRMGSAPCPVVIVSGDCELRWRRAGRLYGTPADWIARRVGGQWTVASVEDADLAAALA